MPCEQAGLRIVLGDPTPGEVAALLVLVSVSGMRRGRDAQCLCQGWQEVGARIDYLQIEERSCDRLRMKVLGPSAKTRAVEKAVLGGPPSSNLRGFI